MIFFSKHSKFNAESKNAIKSEEKILSLSENSISTGSGKLSVLLREYLSLAVNVLRSSPKISYLTQNNFF